MSRRLNLDEFAAFNQQLAGMVKAGLPLEGGLRQLSDSMGRGMLRDECEALRASLEKGAKLEDALASGKLPDTYKRIVTAGAAGGSLAATLVVAADYYGRLAASLARMKAVLAYPILVVCMAIVSSLALAWAVHFGMWLLMEELYQSSYFATWPFFLPTILLVVAAAGMAVLFLKPFRRVLRWKISPFKDESLAQFASTCACLLRSGATLTETLALLEAMEVGSPAGSDVGTWSKRMAQGLSRFDQMAEGSKVFPPFFRWLVAQGGEDLAAGFERASQLYRDRALRKQEAMKQLLIPVTTAMAGCFVVLQFAPLFQTLRMVLNNVGM